MPRRKKADLPIVTRVERGTYRGQGPSAPYLDDDYTLTPEGQRQREAEGDERRAAVEDVEDEKFDLALREMGEIPVSDDPLQERALDREVAWRHKIREEARTLSRDPRDWLRAPRMTQTETSLRVAIHLVRNGHVSSDVTVSLTGRELTRTLRPKFPLEEFLKQVGCKRRISRSGGADWRARYTIDDKPFALRLTDERGACDVMAMASPDSRILVYVNGGSVAPTRSSAEHGTLRFLIGQALIREDVQPLDFLVIAVPRSERTRSLAKAMREAPRLVRAGISVCTVDRTGDVDGLPFF